MDRNNKMTDATNRMTMALALGATMFPSALAQTRQEFKGVIGRTIEESKEWMPEMPKAPEGAPNVLWILLDDVGYGAVTAFGGGCETPVFDSLANAGLRFTNFHTTGLSAPSRAALLTGRNHHVAHMGAFAHRMRSAGFPGYDGRIPSSCATIAEVLRDNGYNTFALGKYGLTPDEEASDAGPFDHWPQGKGFEHFYGFINSSTDCYNPRLVDELNYVKPDGSHIDELLSARAIRYIDRQKKAAPNKPFFMYLAPAATHSPHQAPREWLEKFRGKFDMGWDAYREQTFKRQKAQGLIPANAVLPPREKHIKPWKSLSADEKLVYCRFMEAYAGFIGHVDHQIGKVLNHLREIGQLENTIIITMIGDNGASKSGKPTGTLKRNPVNFGNMKFESDEARFKYTLEHIDEIGTPKGTLTDYPLGWAQACNTPYQFWKGFADSEGGTRCPMIITYGKHLTPGVREQYCHLIDVLPTTLDMLGIEMPSEVRAIKQDTLQGTSLTYTFDNPKAESRHREQYYYIHGSRALYKDGWKLSQPFPANLFGDEKGKTDADVPPSLFYMPDDPTETVDLAKKYPNKVKELQKRLEEISEQQHLYPYYTRKTMADKSVRGLKDLPPKVRNRYENLMGGPSDFKDVKPKY